MAQSTFSQGFALLADSNIRRLFIAYVVTYSGTAMAPIAMAFGVLDLTGSASDAAIVIAAPTLASTVILLFGGVVADRFSRQRIIYCAELVAMAAQLFLAYLFISGTASLVSLTAGMLIMGIAIAFHAPAAAGFIVQLVDDDQLQYANALLGTARNAAMIGGAALGGTLVALVGAGPTLALDGLTFALSAVLVWSMRPRVQRPPEPSSVFEDLKLGWHEFSSHTWLWVIVIQFSLIVAVGESLFGLIGPAYTREFMDGAKDWGWIAAAFGVGTLLGGVASMRVRPRHPMRTATLVVYSFCLVSVALYFDAPLPVIMLAGVVMGTLGQIFGVLWYTTLQLKVPRELLSRVSAYDHLGSIVLAPLGIVAAGWLYEAAGAHNTLLVMIGIVLLSTTAAFSVRDVRNMTTSQSEQMPD